jgi:hypothetical protein
MEAENGKGFNPAPSKQIPQAFAFSFWFLNVNTSVASVTSVANKVLIFLSLILFPLSVLCGEILPPRPASSSPGGGG